MDSDSWQCGCDTNNFYNSFTISGANGEDACPISASLCLDPGQVDFSDREQCEPLYNQAGTGYCSSEVECTRSGELNDDVSVALREWHYVYCGESGSGWTCECNSGQGTVRVSLGSGAQNERELCASMLDVCTTGDIEVEGPKVCEPVFQSASAEYCDASQECTQRANYAGTTVSVNSYISTNCRQVSDGQWQCTCNTAPGSTTFTINGSDSWSTCNEASLACAAAAGAE
jgi:hypothetical protein